MSGGIDSSTKNKTTNNNTKQQQLNNKLNNNTRFLHNNLSSIQGHYTLYHPTTTYKMRPNTSFHFSIALTLLYVGCCRGVESFSPSSVVLGSAYRPPTFASQSQHVSALMSSRWIKNDASSKTRLQQRIAGDDNYYGGFDSSMVVREFSAHLLAKLCKLQLVRTARRYC